MKQSTYLVNGPYAWALDYLKPDQPILMMLPLCDGSPDWDNGSAADDITWEGTGLQDASRPDREAWIDQMTAALRALNDGPLRTLRVTDPDMALRTDPDTARYVAAVRAALKSGQRPPVLRGDCPECGHLVADDRDRDHVVIDVPGVGPVVVVGCEGYFVIDPNAVGIDAPDWQPAEVDTVRLILQRINKPMLEKLRRCAADDSPNWDGRVTIYGPEARGLLALIDAISRGTPSDTPRPGPVEG
jgi:hypothetical protein